MTGTTDHRESGRAVVLALVLLALGIGVAGTTLLARLGRFGAVEAQADSLDPEAYLALAVTLPIERGLLIGAAFLLVAAAVVLAGELLRRRALAQRAGA